MIIVLEPCDCGITFSIESCIEQIEGNENKLTLPEMFILACHLIKCYSLSKRVRVCGRERNCGSRIN